VVWRAGGARRRPQKGLLTTLDTAPPPGSVVVCLDERGPESAKSVPGQQLVAIQEPPAPAIAAGVGEAATTAVVPRAPARPAGRACQEVD
jgi:hypothetical protein